ncbi:hypothetical protein GCM10009827_008290 [Dactylosporangium maewongense]|uniref:Uncharacterized protein n=1 Tax=Dactylosporangium maewongense TaxID=634393 RepID=A0ABN1ZMF7_9ACTN
MQQERAGQERQRRLEAHQRAESAGGELAQRVHLQAERHDAQQDRQSEPRGEHGPGQAGDDRRAGDGGGDETGDGGGDGEARVAADVVTDVLGQQDVPGPARGGRQGERDAGRVGAAVPRLRQQHDAAAGQDGPDQRRAPATDRRHAEGTEELQGGRGGERDPRDRGHERQHQAGGDDPERDGGQDAGAGEVPPPRPHQHEQEQRGADEAQADGTRRADAVEQADRGGQPDLDADHGSDRGEHTAK